MDVLDSWTQFYGTVLNSRPLSHISGDNMEEPITPLHLIIGHRILNLPDDLNYVCDLYDDEFIFDTNQLQVTMGEEL